MSTPIWIARHGATEWSDDDLHTGRRDVELNDDGREQSRMLAGALAGQDFETVLVSPQERTQATCALAGFGELAHEHSALVEWDYGDYEGISDDDVRRDRPDWSLFEHGAPGGETPEHVVERVDAVLAELRERSGPSLLFSHGKTLRVLAARWLGQGARFGEQLPFESGAIGILDVDAGEPVLRLWNFVPGEWR